MRDMNNDHVDAAFRKILADICPTPEQHQLAAIVAAYRRALLDPAARIPTYLHVAIEAARA